MKSGQQYVVYAVWLMNHLKEKDARTEIELHWVPAHIGIDGNSQQMWQPNRLQNGDARKSEEENT